MPDALAASEVTIELVADSSLYLLRLPRRPTITTFFHLRRKAGIEAASEHPDGAVEAGGDVGGGDAESAGGLGGGEVPAVAQFADVPVGGRQRGDHCAELQKKLPLLGPRRGIRTGIFDVGAGLVAGRPAFAVQIQRAIVDDGADPGAGRGAAAVFTDVLQDPHPAFLEDVLGEAVVAGEAPGQGEESPRAAGDPGFPVALLFEKRAGAGGARERGRRQDAELLGHEAKQMHLANHLPGDHGTY